MKTLADVKRRIQIGCKLSCTHLHYNSDLGIRRVVFKDTVRFGFESPFIPGSISYCTFPKAKDLKCIDEDTFIIYRNWYVDGKEQYIPLLRYTFINE